VRSAEPKCRARKLRPRLDHFWTDSFRTSKKNRGIPLPPNTAKPHNFGINHGRTAPPVLRRDGEGKAVPPVAGRGDVPPARRRDAVRAAAAAYDAELRDMSG